MRPSEGHGELSFPELVGILFRWRWLLLAGLLLGGAGGVGAVLAIEPVYTAQAMLLLDPQPARIPAAGVPAESQPLDGGVVDSQTAILASRSLAGRVIDRLGLGDDPDLGGAATGKARAAAAGAAPDPVGRFLDRLDVRREGRSYVIALAYRSSDPARAARVANAVIDVYLEGQKGRKEGMVRQARELLAAQGVVAKSQLEQAQARLDAARAPAAGPASRTGDAELADMNRQLVMASAERSAGETRLQRLRASLADGHAGVLDSGSVMLQNLSTLKAGLLRREAELAGQYGERHPKIADVRAEKAQLDARIAEAQASELRNLEGEVEGARAKERALAAGLETLRGRARTQGEQAYAAEALAREVELDRRVYEALVERSNALAELDGQHEADARVISAAVPPAVPSFPRPKLLVSLGGTAGLFLALALVYLLESRDRGFRAPGEVQAALGLPTLASVPELPAKGEGGADPAPPQDHALEKPRSRYAEALREVLAGLMLDPQGGGRGRVVLLTSVLPDEGKSTLALSLGRIAAAEGLRALVIDVDLRRPSLHDLAGLKPGPGVVELLRGDSPAEDVLRTDPRTPGLMLLTSSGRLSQPTRLLTADRLGRLFDVARERFDLVLVDAAPLAAVADPRLLAPLADRTVLVVRAGATRRKLCEAALATLRETGATLAGVVLSRVDPKAARARAAAELGAAYGTLARYYAD